MVYSLRSLATDKVIKKVDGFRARLDDIKIVDGFNVRTDDDELRDHVQSIVGALIAGQPVPPVEVWVNPDSGEMELVDGHCRIAAYRQYADIEPGFDGYVSVLKFDGSRGERKLRTVSSNSQLKLKPIEIGRAFLAARDEERMTRQQIAETAQRSLAHVDQMILLASAPAEVIQAVERNEISATEAIKLQRDHRENSAAVLGERREIAKAAGKERITEKTAPSKKPAAPSRPKIDFVVSCAAVLVTHIERDAELMDQLKSAGKDDRVSVSADLLLDLIESVREMRESGKALDADQQQELGL